LINLGFITEGKLAAVLITPSLGVPNWSVIYIINTAPLASNAATRARAVAKATANKEMISTNVSKKE
jgi:hypothetical protein